MRGAVLHGLGLNLVQEHLMRRSYGSELSMAFNSKKHPLVRKFVDEIDGIERCKAMCWFARKVFLFWEARWTQGRNGEKSFEYSNSLLYGHINGRLWKRWCSQLQKSTFYFWGWCSTAIPRRLRFSPTVQWAYISKQSPFYARWKWINERFRRRLLRDELGQKANTSGPLTT